MTGQPPAAQQPRLSQQQPEPTVPQRARRAAPEPLVSGSDGVIADDVLANQPVSPPRDAEFSALPNAAASRTADGGSTQDVGSEPADEAAEKQWWDDPGMPWKHKPTRTDLACLSWLGVLGVFSLVMLPLRAWLLAPTGVPLLVALTGSRSGIAALGALVGTGQFGPWWWAMLAGVVMDIKFHWIYWWAGKLWGRGMIEVWASHSQRAAKNYATVERWAGKLGWLGMLISYVPIPLPVMPVVFVLAGANRMSLRTFVLLDALACVLWHMGFFVLGLAMGAPVADVLLIYGKVANYVALAVVVGVVGWSIYVSSRRASAQASR